MADDATVGTKTWTNPNNAKINDGVRTSVSLGAVGATSDYLKATNFGFSIPDGATIDGILVEIEDRTTSAGLENEIKIVKADGSIGAINKSTGVLLPTGTEAYVSYGSSSDLWGETWTPADINDADFGAVFSFIGIGTIYVDHIRITVYYTG
jgi:hypothetical protein